MILSMTASYWNSKFGSSSSAVTNSIKSIKYRYKVSSTSTWSGWITLTTSQYTVSGSSVKISSVTITGTTFTLGTEYTIEVEIIDALSEKISTEIVSKQFTLTSGTVLMSALKGQGVCFGGLYNTSTGGALQVAGNKVLGFVVESSWT